MSQVTGIVEVRCRAWRIDGKETMLREFNGDVTMFCQVESDGTFQVVYDPKQIPDVDDWFFLPYESSLSDGSVPRELTPRLGGTYQLDNGKFVKSEKTIEELKALDNL